MPYTASRQITSPIIPALPCPSFNVTSTSKYGLLARQRRRTPFQTALLIRHILTASVVKNKGFSLIPTKQYEFLLTIAFSARPTLFLIITRLCPLAKLLLISLSPQPTTLSLSQNTAGKSRPGIRALACVA